MAARPNSAAPQTPRTDPFEEWTRLLLQSWEEAPAIVIEQPRPGFRAEHFAVVTALASHVHGLAKFAIRGLDDKLVLYTIPGVRTAFETAVTVQWLVNVSSAMDAFGREAARQRRLRPQPAGDDHTPGHQERTATLIAEALAFGTSAGDQQMRVVKERMKALEGLGEPAYDVYRYLCNYSHPTAELAAEYMKSADFPSAVVVGNPKTDSAGTVYETLAFSLIMAGDAIDRFDPRHHRRSQLRLAARELGFPRLRQTNESWLAEQQALKRERVHRREQAAKTGKPSDRAAGEVNQTAGNRRGKS